MIFKTFSWDLITNIKSYIKIVTTYLVIVLSLGCDLSHMLCHDEYFQFMI